MRPPAWFVLDHRPPHCMPKPRTTTITLTIDVEPFRRAMKRAAEAVANVAHTIDANPALKAVLMQVTEERERQDRRRAARRYLRDVAAAQLIIGRVHLDEHVDRLYADLGIERTPA